MRKMFSQKQIEKIAEEYAGGLPDIHSGDAGKALVVNAGETGAEWAEIGLSPEDQEKLDNSLQLPESAPATQQLVGINTSGEQNSISLGSQFDVVSNELISKVIYVVDWENSTSLGRNDEALNAAMVTDQYPLILVKNIGNSNFSYFHDILFIRSGLGNNYMSYGVFNEIAFGSGGDKLAPAIKMTNVTLAPNGTIGANLQLQAKDSDPVRIIISKDGGTLSSSNATRLLKGDFNNINLAIIISGTLDQISLKVESSCMLSGGKYHPYIYATGQYYNYTGALVESYKVLINLDTKAYTVTVTAA